MPLQDKNRPGRKVTARKVVAYDSDGNPLILDSVTDMAEQFGIATQTAYNIIRRKQVFRGMTFRYLESEQKGVVQNGSRSEETNTRGHNAENG